MSRVFLDGVFAATYEINGRKYLRAALENALTNMIGGETRPPFTLQDEVGVPTYGQLVDAEIVDLQNGESELVGKSELFVQQTPITLWDGSSAFSASSSEKRPFPQSSELPSSIVVAYDEPFLTKEFSSSLLAKLQDLGCEARVTFNLGAASDFSLTIFMPWSLQEIVFRTDYIDLCWEILALGREHQIEDEHGNKRAMVLIIPGKTVVEFAITGREGRDRSFADGDIFKYAKTLIERHEAERIQFMHIAGKWTLNYFHTASGEVVSSPMGKRRITDSVRSTIQNMKDPTMSGVPYRSADDGSPDPIVEKAKQFYIDNYSEIVIRQREDSRMQKRSKLVAKCRFCHDTAPVGTFKNIAHAFPEATGNKTIICESECDQCNQHFGNTIEGDFGTWLLPLRLVSQLSGKVGLPAFEIEGLNVEVTGTGLIVKVVEGTDFVRIDPENSQSTLRIPTKGYVPISVFKTFVKMALSIIPIEKLEYFGKAISWILDGTHKQPIDALCTKVISTFFSEIPDYKAITAILCLRKSDDKSLPYASFAIKFGNAGFQICLPGVSQELQSPDCTMTIHPLLLSTNSMEIRTFDLGNTAPQCDFRQEFVFGWENMVHTRAHQSEDIDKHDRPETL